MPLLIFKALSKVASDTIFLTYSDRVRDFTQDSPAQEANAVPLYMYVPGKCLR